MHRILSTFIATMTISMVTGCAVDATKQGDGARATVVRPTPGRDVEATLAPPPSEARGTQPTATQLPSTDTSPHATGVVHVIQLPDGPDGQFSPRELRVALGDTVEFDWTPNRHATVTSGLECIPDGVWDTGIHAGPYSYTVTFLRPGIFPYFNGADCQYTNGVIVVK